MDFVILIFIMVFFLYQLKRCSNRHQTNETEATEATKSNFRFYKIFSGTTGMKREDEMNDVFEYALFKKKTDNKHRIKIKSKIQQNITL